MSDDQAVTKEYIDNALEALDGALTIKLDKRLEKIEAGVTAMQEEIKHMLNHLHTLEKQNEVSHKAHQALTDQLTELHSLTESVQQADK